MLVSYTLHSKLWHTGDKLIYWIIGGVSPVWHTGFCILVYSVSFEMRSVARGKYTPFNKHLFILAATFRKMKRGFFAITSWVPKRMEVLDMKDERVIYQFLMNQGRGIREDALHHTSHSPSSWWLQRTDRGRKKRRAIISLICICWLCLAVAVDLRAAGIPGTMIKEWKSRDEKRVRDICRKKKGGGGERNRAREPDERPPESYPQCLSSPLSQWGH